MTKARLSAGSSARSPRTPRPRPSLPWLAALLALALAAGCSAEDAAGGDEDDTTQTGDTGDGADAGALDDAAGGEDTAGGSEDTSGGTEDTAGGGEDTSGGTEDTAGGGEDTAGPDCPGAPGCPCTENQQCDVGYCIETADGQVCADDCVDSCSSADFKCATVSTGSDTISICVPKTPNLCNPCNENTECQTTGNGGARCVDRGPAGSYCGVACGADADCPDSYVCGEVTDVAGESSKQCVPANEAACTCSPSAISKKLSTTCSKSAGDSTCTGVRECLPDGAQNAPPGGGLTACLAPVPVDEACDGVDNDCDGDTDEATCDDDNPCTADSCGGAAGCSHTNVSSSCDADGSVCTQNDACVDGTCAAGEALNCDDGNPCTFDTCDAEKGCQYSNSDNTPCDADGNPCTQNDKCSEGNCQPGPVKACESGNACVQGKCSISSGNCVYNNLAGLPCDDGNACTTGALCEGEFCKGSALSCDDGTPCTADSCDPTTGCTHLAIPNPCNDANPCTENDACKDGACVGLPVNASQTCDDGNPCTTDGCDPSLGCVQTPQSGSACDDGNPCTVGDKCNGGLCSSGANLCNCTKDADCAGQEDGNLCNGTLYCDTSGSPFQCKVNPVTVVQCDKSNDGTCANTICEPGTGKCQIIKTPDDTGCNADDNVCTIGDSCQNGFCTPGSALSCNDGNPCTNDACEPDTGCVFTNNNNPCNADDNACTVGDLCQAGACAKGAAKTCDDNEACTADSCDVTTGLCVFTPLDVACDDGDMCTVGDVCGEHPDSGAHTCLSGPKKDCDDGLVCTLDECDAGAGGCTNTIDVTITQPCYTGPEATKNVGICKEGARVCQANGSLGPCVDEVLPEQVELCDGFDNNCDSVTDEGCAPTGFSGRMASAVVEGSSGGLTMRAAAGASAAAGSTADQTYTLDSGFYAWLKAVLKL
jgi:hypothetical protein